MAMTGRRSEGQHRTVSREKKQHKTIVIDQDSAGKYRAALDCSVLNRTANIIARTVKGSKEQYRAVRDWILYEMEQQKNSQGIEEKYRTAKDCSMLNMTARTV